MEITMMDTRWKNAVSEVMGGGAREQGALGLSQGDRHQEILRRKLLSLLSAAVAPHASAGAKAISALGNEIDQVVDALVHNAAKDGLDLDGELLDLLVQISANIHAMQVKWQETIALMTAK